MIDTKRAVTTACLIALTAFALLMGCSSGADDQDGSLSEPTADAAAGPTTDLVDDQSIDSDSVETGDESPVMEDGPDVVDVQAPLAVLAVQGPVEESATYVTVGWSHIDLGRHPDDGRLATGYEVARDGQIIGETVVDDEAWDDLAFRDPGVPAGTHRYQVRAETSSGSGPWSEPVTVEVRETADLGEVFVVDEYDGSDLERAEQAVADAAEAGGGVVLFGSDTYSFDDTLVIDGNGIVLRGTDETETVLRPSFSGTADSCGRANPLLLFRGDPEELDVRVAADVARGSTEIPLDGEATIAVGDFVEVDGVMGQLPTYEYPALEISQDPSTGTDERYPFDAGTVVAVGDETLTLDHPTSPILTEGSRLYRYRSGMGNGIELLAVEGGGPDDLTHHRLIDASYQVDFHLAEVTARWANRNFLDASGHGISVVGFTGIEGGAAGYQPEPCKYKVGFGPATGVVVVDSVFGSEDDDRNMSLMTTQFVYRAVIRNNVFGASRTYGFNEHGGGSRDVVVENNWFGAGPTGWAAILLGNDTWGFGGETAIRSNRFVDNVVDVLMVENPYGVVIAGNRSDGCVEVCVSWSGWGADGAGESAIVDPDGYGSARLVVTGNHLVSSGGGLDLGADGSNGYPWVGVRDVAITGNVIESEGATALQVQGDETVSGRLWVSDNRFDGAVVAAGPGSDWWLWDNSSGPATAEQPLPDWAAVHQAWELERSDP